MDKSKAKAVLKLLDKEGQLLRGLREIKKRVFLDQSNISVFRDLGLVSILLKLVQQHTVQIEIGRNTAVEQEAEALAQLAPEQLEFTDLQRLMQLHRDQPVIGLDDPGIDMEVSTESSAENTQLLLYCTSIFSVITTDYKVKQQCAAMGVVEAVFPLLHSSVSNMVQCVVKILGNMAVPGPSGQAFLRLRGPAHLVKILSQQKHNVDTLKATINAIRNCSNCNSIRDAVLTAGGLETVCTVGLATTELHIVTARTMAVYSNYLQHAIIMQLLDGSSDLVKLLRVWQDSRECGDIHSSTVTVVKMLVRAASATAAHIGEAAYAGVRVAQARLIKALYGSKAATALVADIGNNTGCVPEAVVSALCTLCDGSLEPSMPAGIGKPGVALVWLQVVDAGGVALLVNLLNSDTAEPSGGAAEGEKGRDAARTARQQRKILLAFQALENNHGIQEKVLKHCLAARILPVLALQFDSAFGVYYDAKRPTIEGEGCVHRLLSSSSSSSSTSVSTGRDKDAPSSSQGSLEEPELEMLHGIGDSSSRSRPRLHIPRHGSSYGGEGHPQSPTLVHPLAPISPPATPNERPPLVYTPYSPPRPAPAPPRYSSMSCDSSSSYFVPIGSPTSPCLSPCSSPTHGPAYSPICSSTGLSPTRSMYASPKSPSLSPSHSPLYSPTHSPSYSPIHQGSYSPSYSPIHPGNYCMTPSIDYTAPYRTKSIESMCDASVPVATIRQPSGSTSVTCLSPERAPCVESTRSAKRPCNQPVQPSSNSIKKKKFDSCEPVEVPTFTTRKRLNRVPGNEKPGSVGISPLPVDIKKVPMDPSTLKSSDCAVSLDDLDDWSKAATGQNRSCKLDNIADKCANLIIAENVEQEMVSVKNIRVEQKLSSTSISSLDISRGVFSQRSIERLESEDEACKAEPPPPAVEDRVSKELDQLLATKTAPELGSLAVSAKHGLFTTSSATGAGAGGSKMTILSSSCLLQQEKRDSTVAASTSSSGVQFREFNKIKFRVGSRNKNQQQRHAAAVPSSGIGSGEAARMAGSGDLLPDAALTQHCVAISSSDVLLHSSSHTNNSTAGSSVLYNLSNASSATGSLAAVRSAAGAPATAASSVSPHKSLIVEAKRERAEDMSEEECCEADYISPDNTVGTRGGASADGATVKSATVTGTTAAAAAATLSAIPDDVDGARASAATAGTASSATVTAGANTAAGSTTTAGAITTAGGTTAGASTTSGAITTALAFTAASVGDRLTAGEQEGLDRLELVVRVITQVCVIQEALLGVCREFLPRICLYLRHAQQPHPAATRFLLTITKTPCSIQPLLDTLFPAYVSVQLCEATIVENEHSQPGTTTTSGSRDGTDAVTAIAACQRQATDDLSCREQSNSAKSPHGPSTNNQRRSGLSDGDNDSSGSRVDGSSRTSSNASSPSSSSVDLKRSSSVGTCSSSSHGGGSSSGGGCTHCTQLSSAGHAFLRNMRRFFGHVHQYGSVEARNRLRPHAPPYLRETCLLNLPHVTSCPSLLHSLLVTAGGLQGLFNVVSEGGAGEQPGSVRYMYAAAALHALSHTLQVSSDAVLVNSCVLCPLQSDRKEQSTADGNCDGEISCDDASSSSHENITAVGRGKTVTRDTKTASAAANVGRVTGTSAKPTAVGSESSDSSCCRSAITPAGYCDRCQPSTCVWAAEPDKDLKLVLAPEKLQTGEDDLNEYSDEELSDVEEEAEGVCHCDGSSDASSIGDSGVVSGGGICQRCKKSSGNLSDDRSSCSPAVWAHRSVLCKASGVWAAMLGGGGWKEDHSGEVAVGGMGLLCLRAIVHHLYGCRCEALTSLSLRAYVQLLHACHMYGLTELQEFAARQIVRCCCTGEDVVLVYTAGVGRVQEDIITAVLVQLVSSVPVHTWRRARWLHSLSVSPYGTDLLHNLYTILYRALEDTSSVCNCDSSQSLYMASYSVYDRLH